MKLLLAASATILSLNLGTPANANIITNINISAYGNSNWSGAANGAAISSAPTNGNTGTGLNFTYYNGESVKVGPDSSNGSVTLSFAGVPLTAMSVVNTLMNTAYSVSGTDNANVTFTNNLGATASYSLVGNQTIRDYNNNPATDGTGGLTGIGTNVTAQVWWASTSGITVRLDAQTFTLPSSWDGATLVSMTMTDPYTTTLTDDPTLSALQVDTKSDIPEPMSIVLLGIGLFATAWQRRLRSGNHAV